MFGRISPARLLGWAQPLFSLVDKYSSTIRIINQLGVTLAETVEPLRVDVLIAAGRSDKIVGRLQCRIYKVGQRFGGVQSLVEIPTTVEGWMVAQQVNLVTGSAVLLPLWFERVGHRLNDSGESRAAGDTRARRAVAGDLASAQLHGTLWSVETRATCGVVKLHWTIFVDARATTCRPRLR